MTTALLNGLSGLLAHQRALETTAHNLANAATPGYSRQRSELTTKVPQDTTIGQVGRGVRVQGIQRVYDELLVERLRGSEIELGRLNELVKVLEDLEYVFNEPGDSGLTAAVNQVFAVLEDLSNSPQSNAIRSASLQQFVSFTTLVNSLAAQLEDIRRGFNYAIGQQVEEVNTRVDEIAALGRDIQREVATGHSPNDLLDTRDRLLRELSERVDIGVRHIDHGGIQVDLGGRLLIGRATANHLELETVGNGEPQLVFREGETSANVEGGSISALMDLATEIVPELQADFDELIMRFVGAMNGLHATGNNDSFRAQTLIGAHAIATDDLALNLDDAEQVLEENQALGIPAALLPDFTDADGRITARNLTINVYDPETGVADKYTVRYEPGGGVLPATRSLTDLVDAINTGVGGGFRVYPPAPGGVAGLTARAVAVDGGAKLQLEAAAGRTIDFSRALDLQPDRQAWTGGSLTVAAPAAIPCLGGDRIAAEVAAFDTTVVPPTVTLDLYTYDPVDGRRRSLNVSLSSSITVPLDGTVQNLLVENRDLPPVPPTYNLQFSAPAGGTYTVGESFVVDFDPTGSLLDGSGGVGPATVAKTWTDGAATMTVHGRYTGELSMDPSRPWSMEVVQSGVVGAPAAAAPPAGAPIVKFTYYTGSATHPHAETVLVTLDENNPPGTPVAIAEGVYAEFGAGSLHQHGATDPNRLEFTVDAEPDQAGLLAALNVNGLFTGRGAADVAVRADLRSAPEDLLVGHTRAAGDNANLEALIGVRDAALYAEGSADFDETYQGLVSDVASRIRQTEDLKANQEALHGSLENRRDEVSGVNIDEEVSNLILQQQAYQASAKVINIERENMQALLNLFS